MAHGARGTGHGAPGTGAGHLHGAPARGTGTGHGHRARAPGNGGAVDGAGGVHAGTRLNAMVLIEEIADGGWALATSSSPAPCTTSTTRRGGRRGEFGSRGAPSGTR
jgi:hypothetical protein